MLFGSSTVHLNIFIKITLLEVPGYVIYKNFHYYNWLSLSEVIRNLNAFWKFHYAFKYFYKNTLLQVLGCVLFIKILINTICCFWEF